MQMECADTDEEYECIRQAVKEDQHAPFHSGFKMEEIEMQSKQSDCLICVKKKNSVMTAAVDNMTCSRRYHRWQSAYKQAMCNHCKTCQSWLQRSIYQFTNES